MASRASRKRWEGGELSGLLQSGGQAKVPEAIGIFPIRATCSTYLLLPNLFALV